jgi:hypothetical protein
MKNETQTSKILTPQQPLQTPTSGVVKHFKDESTQSSVVVVVLSLVVVLLGVTTGWLLSGTKASNSSNVSQSVQQTDTMTKSDTEAGIADESQFGSDAEGTLTEGGIDGEGTHHLERSGGPSQNVYLTSTVIDLQSFVGKEVRVWGDTISGQDAGWLMDVGKIKVIQ